MRNRALFLRARPKHRDVHGVSRLVRYWRNSWVVPQFSRGHFDIEFNRIRHRRNCETSCAVQWKTLAEQTDVGRPRRTGRAGAERSDAEAFRHQRALIFAVHFFLPRLTPISGRFQRFREASPPSEHSEPDPAVGGDGLAGDPAGAGRGNKQHRGRDVVGPPDAAERRRLGHALQYLFVVILRHP